MAVPPVGRSMSGRHTKTLLADDWDRAALKAGQRGKLLAQRPSEHHQGGDDRDHDDETDGRGHGGDQLQQEKRGDREPEDAHEKQGERHRRVFASGR